MAHDEAVERPLVGANNSKQYMGTVRYISPDTGQTDRPTRGRRVARHGAVGVDPGRGEPARTARASAGFRPNLRGPP